MAIITSTPDELLRRTAEQHACGNSPRNRLSFFRMADVAIQDFLRRVFFAPHEKKFEMSVERVLPRLIKNSGSRVFAWFRSKQPSKTS
jgi:hypothetical protein